MAAFTGFDAEKIAYTGLLQTFDGFVIGEIPALPGVEASGMSTAEVVSTLQGLLEEHIEALLDTDAPLPEDVLPLQGNGGKLHTFCLFVPNTVNRSVLASVSDLDDFHNQHTALQFKAVILQDKETMRGHFPDLTGAFTSGRSIAELQAKLQCLLETYVGLLLRSGEPLPKASFAHAKDLDMTDEELAKTPIIGLPTFTIDIPA